MQLVREKGREIEGGRERERMRELAGVQWSAPLAGGLEGIMQS